MSFNYVKMRIGDIFNIVSVETIKSRKAGEPDVRRTVKQLARKTSHTGYVPIGHEYMGEVQFDAEVDNRIEFPAVAGVPAPEPIPTPAEVETAALRDRVVRLEKLVDQLTAAKKPAKKKAAAKKPAKKKARK